MGSIKNLKINNVYNEEEEDFLRVMQLPSGLILPMVLKTAIELDMFEIIAKAGPDAQLSATEIASNLSTQNQEAPVMIDRMLRFLASNSFLTCTSSLVVPQDQDGNNLKRLYSLAPMCKKFIKNEDGVSLAQLLLLPVDKVIMESWFHLKDAILEGGIPFNRAHGMHAFAYPAIDSRFNEVFNRGMYNHTLIAMKRLLEVYEGFDGVKEVVDVGGGLGATLACIISKYPNIQGINFDLPHVIDNAPARPGVEHVGGDMFESVPKGEVILMKWILHDWSDGHCQKLLENCFKASPDHGKVILVEAVLPETPDPDLLSKVGFQSDMSMMAINPGGKERTEKEFEALAKEAGFTAIKLMCRAYSDWVIELYKN
ncbi:hypothetical protein ACH5RR_010441 [Cinchona calisaya]|uniref:Caffeic acid 3-O-methyltransferase n=1 Tax=Cinchona calisaya TaxID=153742 RepID=A0ABD3AIZ3_9GENT